MGLRLRHFSIHLTVAVICNSFSSLDYLGLHYVLTGRNKRVLLCEILIMYLRMTQQFVVLLGCLLIIEIANIGD